MENKEKKNENIFIEFIKNIVGYTIGIFGWLIKAFLCLFSFGLILGCIIGVIAYIKVKPDLDECRKIAYDKIANMDESDFMKNANTHIYDKDGNVIGIINAGNFQYVDINHISIYIQNTYISQEDKRFKEHSGVDWISTIRAGLSLVKNKGEITQGGSTITQQVIKNTYLTQEKSFKRKLIEIMLAPELEKKFNKAKIMEFYCNTNYYGNRCYGVEAASQFYFGKSASEVSVSEAAMLVGLSNSPSAYDPVKHYDAALKKRNSIIENLYANGFITENKKNEALNEELVIVQKEGEKELETYQSTYAIHCATLTLMKKDNFNFQYTFNNKEEYDSYISRYEEEYNEKNDEIRSGGYEIYTSLDSNIQEKLQNNIDTILSHSTELQENGKYALQGAAAIADNQTGYIVAIVGGRGTDDQFNRAYLSARQPGSAIKPLIDYTPGFDTGEFYPSKIMNDHKIENGPKNSGGNYRGNITVREAVNRSINTIAWQVLQEIGVNNGLAYLGNMRFHKLSYIDNNVASLSIGGFTNGTRIVDMAKGYQTLANYGEYNDKTCITDIKDSSNNSVIANVRTETKQVYEKDSAYLMTDVLKGTINESYGTGHGLGLANMPAAGKTGTTNSNKDTWFCGYTKYYTTAVWVGYDTPKEMPGVYGATYAGKIWQNVMNEIHTGLEPLDWDAPETVYESYYNPSTGEATENNTGVKDLFSRTAEIKLAELEKQKEQQALYEKIEKQVQDYENSTISSQEDVYSLDRDFDTINNIISQIEDQTQRTDLYNRIYKKYKELLAIKNDMKDEIAEYEKNKKESEEAAQEEAKKKAEEDRLKFIQKTKEQNAENAIKKVEELKYIPENEELINNAKSALNEVKSYSSYDSYYTRLQKAIDNINNLPSYTEYQNQLAIKESEEAESRAKEESERESMQDELNSVEIKIDQNPESDGPSKEPVIIVPNEGSGGENYGQD